MGYLQTNHSVDYHQILQDAKALKTLNPQILADLQQILHKDGFFKENQENNSPLIGVEKVIYEENSKSSGCGVLDTVENLEEKSMKKEEGVCESAKKKWWTPYEVFFLRGFVLFRKFLLKDEELTKLVEKYGVNLHFFNFFRFILHFFGFFIYILFFVIKSQRIGRKFLHISLKEMMFNVFIVGRRF